MFNIHKANTTLLSDNNIWFSAFPSLLIFGEIEDFVYIKNKHFVLYKCDFVVLYQALINICHSIAQNSSKKEYRDINDIFLKRAPSTTYSWSLSYKQSVPYITFFNEPSSEYLTSDTLYKIICTLDELNDIILIFSKLILPTLCLQSNITKSLVQASNLSISDLKPLNSFKVCEEFVTKHNLDESTALYLFYYKEIVILVNKISSLYNPSIKNDIIDTIISSKAKQF